MVSLDVSAFKFYSHGRVAENKPLSTKTIPVVPIEMLGLLDGEIADREVELTHKGVDDLGRSYEVKVKTHSTILCEWLPFGGSNRVTAPDVRRGERVMILRYADTNLFYWTTMGLDDILRRLETSIWLFSDVPEGESNEELTAENCYSVEVSTHRKLINIMTSQRNGEPFKYTLQINAADGCVTLTDDVRNYIELDSAETKITLHNKEGTYWSCDKRDLVGYAPRDMLVKVDRDVLFEAARDINLTAGRNMRLSAVGEYVVQAPKIMFDGDVLVTGASQFQKAMQANGIESPKPIRGPSGTI